MVKEVDPASFGGDVALIDVRTAGEFEAAFIPGAVSLPLDVIAGRIADVVGDRDQTIVLYCNSGINSVIAGRFLDMLGYTDVASMTGGLVRWSKEGRPIEGTSRLTPEQRTRYSRHLSLDEVGEEGQRRLRSAGVVVVGAGGLGSPVALYLAAAGIGRLTVIDFDEVELSNLQRQIAHDTPSVGQSKAASAADRVAALNPDVVVNGIQSRLTAANALDVLADHHLIIDATDDFPTRYLINDAALHLGTPVVHGSILRFEGHATVLWPGRGPCYRCLFPTPPTDAPTCEDAGVLGAMAGMIGSIQALETIKLITGAGKPLIGTLLTYDGLDHTVTRFEYDRRPDCASCSGPLPELTDYDASCQPRY
ncbi:MAG: molybdopterin-synthase adenylyltransferase MoeB [Acidimicrobiia bacterium]|nr:molybdopterin-synthase adenylyltransferase MoeB [Acidimicrobiia bacterium]